MYESHYGFEIKPFSIVPNPNIVFLNENYQNALSYMRYGLKERVGFILLTGEIGAGKTTLIRYLLSAMDEQMDIGVIFNTNFSSDQVFRWILSEFEIISDSMEKERQLELLYEFLIDRYAKRRHVLLIIDEAQNLSNDALEDIRMLSNLQTNDQILLQIMLVGQPELRKRLASPNLRQLAQRIAVSYHLPPLTEDQTYLYVAYRIEAVGGQSSLFTPEAVKLIHDSSGGIPRTINLLCDAALVYGYADDLQRIDESTVKLVLADRICILDPKNHVNDVEPPQRIESPGETDDLRSRMSLVEHTVCNLQRRVEDLSCEVRNELFFRYEKLLTSERTKYDQLKIEYDQLLQEHARLFGQTDRIMQHTVNNLKVDAYHQQSIENISDKKGKNPSIHRRRMWWRGNPNAGVKYANDGDFILDSESIKPSLWQRIADFNPMEKLSPLGARILLKGSSLFAKASKKYKNYSMIKIRVPSVMRLGDGVIAGIRVPRHWLFWIVILMIPILGISLFFSAKRPMTANAPIKEKMESRAETKLGPPATAEKERIATAIPNKTADSKSVKAPEITFDSVVERHSFIRHIVRTGDTLTSIAREYKTTINAIIRENNLQNNLIYIGQILKVPLSDGKKPKRSNTG